MDVFRSPYVMFQRYLNGGVPWVLTIGRSGGRLWVEAEKRTLAPGQRRPWPRWETWRQPGYRFLGVLVWQFQVGFWRAKRDG